MYIIKKESHQRSGANCFVGNQQECFSTISIGTRPFKVLVAKPGNVTSLRLNSALSEVERRYSITDIDYCDSAVNLICALEDNVYEVIFLDYNLDHIDLCALLAFVRLECPNTKVVVTSAPVWTEQAEKEKVTALCSSCCHEDFYDLDVNRFIHTSQDLREFA